MVESSTVSYEGIHCKLVIERPADSVVIVKLSGHDIGEFGDAPFKELQKDIQEKDSFELFIDAREVRGASIEVSGSWAHWLLANNVHFRMINMLTGSRFIQLTADFVKRYAELGEQMRIYTSASAFDNALTEALNS